MYRQGTDRYLVMSASGLLEDIRQGGCCPGRLLLISTQVLYNTVYTTDQRLLGPEMYQRGGWIGNGDERKRGERERERRM